MTHLTHTPTIARAERTILRRTSPDDCMEFQAYRTDPDIARFQSWDAMSDAEALEFLRHVGKVEPLLRPGHWSQIAVAHADTDGMIGDMGLFPSSTGQEAEIGITLARAHQGQGHATTAMTLAIDLIFATTGVSRIICGADQRNAPSLALIARLPFRFTHSEEMPGGVDDMYELTRQMWQDRRSD